MKIIFRVFSILLVIFPFFLTAQVDSTRSKKEMKRERRASKSKYINFSLLVGTSKTQDFAVSPLKFKGTSAGGGLSYYNRGKNSEWSISSTPFISNLSNEYSISNTQSISANINFYYLRISKKLTGKRIRTYIGGYILNNVNFRINPSYFNASFIYDAISSIGISAKINTGFSFKNKSFSWNNQGTQYREKYLSLDYQLSLPIVNGFNRPGYATINNFPSTESSNIEEEYIGSWESITRITSKLDLTLFMKNHNAIRMSYYWDTYSIHPEYNKATVSNGGILITLMLRLNKKIIE